VFGQFPTTDNDPKAPVIWEAFQPQTEAVHSQRSTFGDPYSPQYLALWQQAAQAQAQAAQLGQQPSTQRPRQPSPAPGSQPAAPVATAPEPQPTGLPTPNGR
jgi:hypothetical protein